MSTGPLALFDLPWMPIYLLICFLFHPWIGVAALVGAVILTSLTLLSEFMTRKPSRVTMQHVGARNSLAEAGRRNAEVLQAMGMAPRMGKIWGETNIKYLASQQQTSDVAGGLGAISKVLRLALQSGVLGLGAYLVIQQQATAGIIIASLHHRGARARAGRTRHRELARICLGPPELAAAVGFPRRDGQGRGADGASRAEGEPRPWKAWSARRRACSGSSCRISASGSRPGRASASSGRAPRASRRSRG